MSEIKGQLLGILLVLMVFATVSTAAGLIFNDMTTGIKNQVSEVIAGQ